MRFLGGLPCRLFAFCFDAVENVHDGVAQSADGYAGIVGQAEVHAAAPTLDENGQISRGLRFRQASKAFCFDAMQRNVFEFVGGNEQEHAVVRTAFL